MTKEEFLKEYDWWFKFIKPKKPIDPMIVIRLHGVVEEFCRTDKNEYITKDEFKILYIHYVKELNKHRKFNDLAVYNKIIGDIEKLINKYFNIDPLEDFEE